jgi:hypothetical protein
MTKSKTYRAGKSPAPPRSTSSKTVVLHLLPETDSGGYPQFNFEREIFKYSPDVTLPFAYSQECNFVSTPAELTELAGASPKSFDVSAADATPDLAGIGFGEAGVGPVREPVKGEAREARKGPAAEAVPGGNRYADRVCNVLREFETKSAHGEWPGATNAACYWCCHRFDGVPIGLPVRFCNENDGFCATGCFCGTACAAAFNQNSNESNNVKCGRHNMLCMLSMALGHGEEVTVAPPRTVLSMFGGYASIEEFRRMSGESRIFLSSMPPMRFLATQIEEVSNANVSCGFRDRVVPLDTERVERGITLRRTKPLLDYKNTLDHSMRLTITQTSSPPAP